MKRALAAACLGLLLSSAPVRAGEVTGKVALPSGSLGAPKTSQRTIQDRQLRSAGYSSAEVPRDRGGGNPLSGVTEVENVVLYLEGNGLPAAPPEKPVVLSQADKIFRPHVLPVVTGTTVQFPNAERIPLLHHVFSLDPNFSFPKYGKAPVPKYTFRSPAFKVVELFCGIHSRMNAYIVVLPNSAFTKAGKDGSFRIRDVPDGTYTLRAWHPRAARSASCTVKVPSANPVQLSF